MQLLRGQNSFPTKFVNIQEGYRFQLTLFLKLTFSFFIGRYLQSCHIWPIRAAWAWYQWPNLVRSFQGLNFLKFQFEIFFWRRKFWVAWFKNPSTPKFFGGQLAGVYAKADIFSDNPVSKKNVWNQSILGLDAERLLL
jgi:hypothetical protein